MRRFVRRAATVALAAAAVVAVYGCSEQLEAGRACPILCPGQDVELRDTLVAGVILDSSLAGYPAIGGEPLLLLTSRGDTLETRVIVRYDTLPTTFRPPNSPTDAPIESVENAQLQIRLHFPTRNPDQTVTVDAYDVDTTAAEGDVADTAAATMLPLFRSERFLGSLTFKPTDLTDSIARIPIDNAYLLAKIQAKARLRVGLLVRGDASAELVFQGLNAGRPLDISFCVASCAAPATPVLRTAAPYSATPADRFVGASLGDFVIVGRRRPSDTPPEVMAVGGVPGRRTYLRFDLPRGIVDSTSVVRATLLLTQYPNRLAARASDTISIYPQPVAASERVTDIGKAASLLAPVFDDPNLRLLFRLDSLRTAPEDSGSVEIEAVGVLRIWRATQPEQASRALVLRIPLGNEGAQQDEIFFFSTEAPAELRPRLRIVYVPRVGIGLP